MNAGNFYQALAYTLSLKCPVMLFLPKLIAGYSGGWVDVIGYPNFFILTAALGVPALGLVIWISKVAPVKY